MPLYRYQCEACGHVFRVLQSLNGDSGGSAAGSIACENCGEESVRRVLSRVGVLYKGSGFYSTDYAKKGSKNEKKEPGDKAKD